MTLGPVIWNNYILIQAQLSLFCSDLLLIQIFCLCYACLKLLYKFYDLMTHCDIMSVQKKSNSAMHRASLILDQASPVFQMR